jgi:hypothetical protein
MCLPVRAPVSECVCPSMCGPACVCVRACVCMCVWLGCTGVVRTVRAPCCGPRGRLGAEAVGAPVCAPVSECVCASMCGPAYVCVRACVCMCVCVVECALVSCAPCVHRVVDPAGDWALKPLVRLCACLRLQRRHACCGSAARGRGPERVAGRARCGERFCLSLSAYVALLRCSLTPDRMRTTCCCFFDPPPRLPAATN